MGGIMSREISDNRTISPSHISLPEEETPYPGPAVAFKIIPIDVKMKEPVKTSFHQGDQSSQSDLLSYFRILQDNYNAHLRLTTFLRIPLAASRLGYVPKIPCLAIFCDVDCFYTKKFTRYRLVVDQICVKLELLPDGPVPISNLVSSLDLIHPLVQNILTHTQNDDGGRLICAAISSNIVGQGRPGSKSPKYFVDMMYEFPMHSRPTPYAYIAYVTSMIVHFEDQEINAECSLSSILPAYLSQGWKVVDILIAQQQLTFDESSAKPEQLKMVCFFEKKKANRCDPTPKYEVKIVDYLMVVRFSNGAQTHTSMDLSKCLEDMGMMGWKLVCVLDVPEMKRTSEMRVLKKISLFFQRKIRASQPAAGMQTFHRTSIRRKRIKSNSTTTNPTSWNPLVNWFIYKSRYQRVKPTRQLSGSQIQDGAMAESTSALSSNATRKPSSV